MFRSTIAALAVLLASAPAAAREPVVLAPVKPWNLHYADNSCQLFRTFGDPAKPTTLVIERISPTSDMSLMVFGGVLRASLGSGDAKAVFLPFDTHVFSSFNVAETLGTKETAILWSAIDFQPGWKNEEPRRKNRNERQTRNLAREAAARALEAETAAKVTGLQITEPNGRKTILQTGSLAKANAMMRDCAREQLVKWGVDPEVQDKIVRGAYNQTNLATLFSESDYPRQAVFEGNEAIVRARLNVGADGAVTRCTSLTAYRPPEFAEVVCKNLSRAKFLPAELADGTPVPTVTTVNVRFQMP
jgi:hypothetical protein